MSDDADAASTRKDAAEPPLSAATPSTEIPPLEFPDAHCPQCDYNLHGLPPGLCPECGLALTPADLVPSQIPWVHRRRIGLVRAYIRTILFVLRNRRDLRAEFDHAVSYRDAQLFRWTTLLIAYPPLALLIGFRLPALVPAAVPVGPAYAIALSALLEACLLIWLAAATGLPSYFFHPRSLPVEKQNCAVALSYYAAAPLALMPAGLVLLFTALLILPLQEALASALGLAGMLTPIGLFVLWAFELAVLAAHVHPRGWRYGVFVGTAVPVLWTVCLLVTLVGIPVVVLLNAVIILSLL